MRHNVTAIYRTHAVADLVRQELQEMHLASGDIHVIPDRADASAAGTDRDRYVDELYDLHLPDDDQRSYEQCILRGDYVVSVDVDDDDDLARIQGIMRRPEEEAYNLDAVDTEFANTGVAARRDPARPAPDPDWVARRHPDYTDSYVRSYSHNRPPSAPRS
ncbi:MAG TPA: hypothetical protein VGN80_02005 [Devosiaceae bacterium]|jgi:hypothetical protein|nr:hypothetical protein [Devosiaceae bacterium]